MAERFECEICLEKCLEDELEEHREMCMAQLMFRCAICDGDYVSKEGLLNHLDLHDIADESKELHYQEIRATFKLYQCTLCNDQRGYQENVYWKHVHEKHDDFFGRWADCGESFRSRKLKTNHDFTHYKARESGVLEADQKFSYKVFPMQVENTTSLVSCGEINENTDPQLKSLQGELISVPMEDIKCSEMNKIGHQRTLVLEKLNEDNDIGSQLNECSPKNSNVGDDTDDNMTEKESEVISIPISKSRSEEHKHAVLITLKEKSSLLKHVHHGKSTPNQSVITDCSDLSQYAAIQEVADPEIYSGNCSGQRSALTKARKANTHEEINSPDDLMFTGREKVDPRLIEHSPANSHTASDSNNVTEKKFKMQPIISMKGSSETKVTEEKTWQPLVENPSSGSSDTKCTHCGKECSNVCGLARHIERNHVPQKCDVCGITFSGAMKAWYHKKTKHTEAKYTCPHCQLKFHYERDYRLHLTRCGSKKFSCKLCDQKLKGSNYVARHMRNVHKIYGALKNVPINRKGGNKEHENNHTEKIGLMKEISVEGTTNPLIIIGCPICGENVSDKSQLSRHLEAIHQMTMCPSCGMAFANVEQLIDHKTSCCQHLKHVESQYSSKAASQPYGETSSSGLSDTLCPHCGKDCCHGCIYENAFAVKDHMRQTHSLKESQTDHIDFNELNQARQPYDGVNLIQGESMEIKMEIQVEETTLQEDEYRAPDEGHGKSSTITSTSQHTTRKRPGKQKLSCNKCHQTFQELKALEAHANEHMMENDQKCPICERTFENRYRLAYHKRTAHNELRHKCWQCPKIFHHISSLRRHEATHSKILETEGSMVCNLCPERFLDESGLLRHIANVHPPAKIACDKCDLKFTNYRKLVYHLKTFHTEPGFKCIECGKLFYYKTLLRRHMSVHLKTNQKRRKKSPEVLEQQIDDDLEQNQNSSLQNVEFER